MQPIQRIEVRWENWLLDQRRKMPQMYKEAQDGKVLVQATMPKVRPVTQHNDAWSNWDSYPCERGGRELLRGKSFELF